MKEKGLEIYNPFKILLQMKNDISDIEKKKANGKKTPKVKK